MTTKKQIEANQQNAQKSTGPKTLEGKSISCRNATKHGLYAKPSYLIPDDDPIEFKNLIRRYLEAYNPVGILEEEEFKCLIEYKWRLMRLNKVESELFQSFSFYEGEDRGVGTAFAQDAYQGNAFSKLSVCEERIYSKFRKSEVRLRNLQNKRKRAIKI